MPKVKLTWNRHKRRWTNCTACDLCNRRSKVVLGRGQLPADVVFVGEAPGGAEDALGRPFVGPAGKLLDEIIEASLSNLGMQAKSDRPRMVFTNMVGCVPKYKPGKIEQPKKPNMVDCAPRLNEIIQLADAKAIVMVGAIVSKHAPELIDYDFEYSADLTHPAALLRATPVRKPILIDAAVIKLTDLFEQVLVPF